jgi:hypothetical protein
MRLPVTLQVNVNPMDYPCARRTLPHQLRQLGDLMDEVLVIFDLRRSSVSYSQTWEDRRPLMRDLLHDCRYRYSNLRVLEVDYSPAVSEAIGARFLGRQPVPHADARGGPFYAYLYGLHMARNDDILHLDGDILVGGGAVERWIERASDIFQSRRDVVGISPLPGPPAVDGSLREPPAWWRRDESATDAYCFDRFQMRAVFMQRVRFITRLGPLRLKLAAPLHVLSGWSAGHPPYRELDVTVSHAMSRRGLARLALLGPEPGLWTLRPRQRTQAVIDALPDIVRAIEDGHVPDEQRGDGNLNEALAGWRQVPAPAERQLVGA